MKSHCKKLRNALEDLLFAISHRERLWSLSDVFRRMIRTARFYTIYFPDNDMTEHDMEKFESALWSVLSSTDSYVPIDINITIPGIHGKSSRFEFARQYAYDLFYESVAPEGCTIQVGLEVLEQNVVAAVLLFLVCRETEDLFPIESIYRHLYTTAMNHPPAEPIDQIVHLSIQAFIAADVAHRRRVVSRNVN